MAVSPRGGTFEQKLHEDPLAQLKEQAENVDIHHTRRLPCWVCLCCKETKKRMPLSLAVTRYQTASISGGWERSGVDRE